MRKEKEYFIDSLSMLLASGMVVNLALSSINEEIKSRKLKKIIGQIETDIDAGFPLWKALEKTRIFPAYTVSLIRIGEKTGKLAENLKVVASQSEKDRELSSKISSAMVYPIFVFTLTVIVGVGIAWFILPKLANVFASLRIDLPLITQILINIGNFLAEYGIYVVPGAILVLIVLFYFLFSFSKTAFIGQALLFLFAPARRLIQEIEISRFGFTLGTLLTSGLPVVEALDSLHQASTFYNYRRLYAHLRDRVEEGNSFQKSLASFPSSRRLIPTPIQQLLISAEASGRLPESLLKIGEMYEQKADITTKNLSVLLEPVLLVIVWLGVVAVALAVILPLYSLLGGINQ